MPNYVKNIIKFNNKEDFNFISKKYMSITRNNENFFDFNKIIERSEDLDISESSSGDLGMNYLNNKNDFINDKKDWVLNIIEKYKTINKVLTNNQIKKIIDSNSVEISNSTNFDIELGKKYIKNIENYGYKTWYDWSIHNWGTKWNARETNINENDLYIAFETAWDVPIPIFTKIIANDKNISFDLYYADEGFGFSGLTKFSFDNENNEIITIDIEYKQTDENIESFCNSLFDEDLNEANHIIKIK